MTISYPKNPNRVCNELPDTKIFLKYINFGHYKKYLNLSEYSTFDYSYFHNFGVMGINASLFSGQNDFVNIKLVQQEYMASDTFLIFDNSKCITGISNLRKYFLDSYNVSV